LVGTATVTDSTVTTTNCAGSADYCAIFDSLYLNIAKDATKKMTVKANVYALDETSPPYSEGEGISASVVPNAANIIAIDSNDADLLDAHITGTMTGKTIYLYLAGPQVSNISAKLTETKVPDENNTQWMDGEISFKLTAVGYDIVIPATGIAPIAMNLTEATRVPGTAAPMVTIDGRPLGAGTTTELHRTISAGSSRDIVVRGRITAGSANNGDYVYLATEKVQWTWDEGTGTLPSAMLEHLVTSALIWVSGL